MLRIRSYKHLKRLPTFEERFDYLSLSGSVGRETFGFDRYINQSFYRSREWADVRGFVIVRDNGCDLGFPGREIHSRVYIHHMNPMIVDDIVHGNPDILDPEYLICVTHQTHNAIHYGDKSKLKQPYIERKPNDTKLW